MKSDIDKSIRLFIGSPLTGYAWEKIYGYWQEQKKLIEKQVNGRMSWIASHNWHLTWLFMGNVQPLELPDIKDKITCSMAGIKPVMLEFEKLVFWPNHSNARLLVWEGAGNSELFLFHNRIRHVFPELEDDKPFIPHITLARIKKTEKSPIQLPYEELVLAQNWHIKDVCLYQSYLTPKGAIYKNLQTWSLVEI